MLRGVVSMLERIVVRNFRCFETAQAFFSAGINLFSGRNAQGKTSILEAVCVLLRLSSPRTPRLAHAIRHGCEESGFTVAGETRGHRVEIRFSPMRRQVLVDGLPPRDLSEFVSSERVVWFGNADMQLASGPAELRRRYLDFLGGQLCRGYRRALGAYEHALRSRNRLLRNPGSDSRSLEAFNGPFVEAGMRLENLRAHLVGELVGLFRLSYARLSGGEEASICYQSGSGDDLARVLKATSAQERRLGHTVAGPHRDDLDIQVEGRPAARYCSEGQQRTIAVALKLAQAELLGLGTETPPVFLIDDVFGELDATRRSNLVEAVTSPGVQALITTTNAEGIAGLSPQKHYLVDGAVLHELG